MEIEGVEQQIFLQPEMAVVGAVYSVNGYTGHVVLTTSDLENTSDYQTSTDVAAIISAHNTSEEAHPYIQALISAKQDPIVAGNGINVSDENVVSVDTTVVATQQNLATEVTNRENADIALQGQIDAISASSDVVDIVGTYAELQSYDTSKLKDNDIIKVLQDSTQGNATTYYRWSTTTQTFTLIGQEGPYYTKAAADAQFVPQTRTINSKPLSANITLTASDVSALGQSDIVQTTGTSTTKVMSQNAVTNELATKLDSSSVPDRFFDGEATVSPTAGTSLEIDGVIKVKSVELQGDTQQQTYTGKNLVSSDRTLGAPSDTSWGNATKRTFDTGTYVVGLSRNNYYSPNNVTVSKNAGAFTVTSTQNYYGMNLPIDVDSNNTYCLSYSVTNSSYSYSGVGFYAQDGTFLSDKILSNGGNFQPPAGTKTAVILLGLIEANETCVYSDIQLEIGSTATAYEPYVGGVPSPNPDYPQTVSVVTGTQTVTVTGKNLFDVSKVLTNGTNLVNNGNGSITASLSTGAVGSSPNTLGTYCPSLQVGDTVSLSFTTTGSINYIYLGAPASQAWVKNANKTITQDMLNAPVYWYGGTGNAAITYSDIQVELGTSVTSYEPYQSQTYTVDLGATELCKIGNYQDYIYQGSDGWYMHKAIGKVVLDGSETWSRAGLTTGARYFSVRNDIGLRSVNSDGSDIMSDKFVGVDYVTYYSIGGINGISHSIYQSNNYIQLFFATDSFGDTTALKNWLSTHNTTVYYALATATDTKITDSMLISQLEGLANATLYRPTSNIVVSGNLPAILGVTAYTDNLSGIIEILANS